MYLKNRYLMKKFREVYDSWLCGISTAWATSNPIKSIQLHEYIVTQSEGIYQTWNSYK